MPGIKYKLTDKCIFGMHFSHFAQVKGLETKIANFPVPRLRV